MFMLMRIYLKFPHKYAYINMCVRLLLCSQYIDTSTTDQATLQSLELLPTNIGVLYKKQFIWNMKFLQTFQMCKINFNNLTFLHTQIGDPGKKRTKKFFK